MAYGNGQREVTESVLYIVKKMESDSGKSRMELRVVSWNYNEPTIELRSFFQKEGKWLCGKAHGLRDAEFDLIADMKAKDPKKYAKVKKTMALRGKEDIKNYAQARKEKLGIA